MNPRLVGVRLALAVASASAFTLLAGCGSSSSGDSTSAPELSAPAKLTLVSGDNQSVSNGPAAATAPLIVMVTDPKNRPLKDVTVAWTASDPNAKLSAGTSNTDGSGQAQVAWTLGDTPGVQTVTATVSQIAGERVVFQGKNAVTSISGSVTRATSAPIAFSATRTTASALLRASNRTASRTITATNAVKYSQADMRAVLDAHRAPSRRLIVHIDPGFIGAARAFATTSGEIAASRDALQRTVARFQSRGLAMRAEVSPAIMAARVTVPDSVDVQTAAAAFAADASVSSVEVDEIVPMLGDYYATEATAVRAPSDARPGVSAAAATLVPNDPLLLNQYWHYNLVGAFNAWTTTTGSSSVLVAVVDQGVRFDHPSMAANFTNDGYNFVAAGNRLASPVPICATSGTGTSAVPEAGPSTDPTLPDDFTGISNGCLVRNTVGDHGLHVSGTIGAPGNDGVGASGLNWSVSIRPVRVLDVTGSGSFFDIAQGVLYAAGLPAAGATGTVTAPSAARVINMSLGGSGDSPVLHAAVQAATAAGSLIVASAGNGATTTPSFPAAYPEVLSVVALGPDLQLATYTSVGPNVSLAAPGGDFRFTANNGTGGVLSTTYNYVTKTPNYAFYTGTSMAAPHVTGVAALVLAANPTMTAAQLRQRLQSTALDVGAPGRDDRYGFGIVNAYNALNNITSPNAGKSVYVRVVDATSGDTVKTVAANADGSYSATKLAAGNYYVVAGEDDGGDKKIGVPGRRLGWFGSAITLTAGQSASASIAVGTPLASKPNGSFSSASRLVVNSYLIDQVTTTDPVATFVVQIPKAATYTFETSGVLGTCGLALELDTSIELYDSTQTLKARNDNTSLPTGVFCSQIATALTPGTYYIRVFQSTAATPGSLGGQFRIAVRDTP